MRKGSLAIAALACALAAAQPAWAGPEARCKACHTFGTQHRMGPGLKGVFGRKAASAPGYRYTYAQFINGEPWVWDEEHLRAFITNPTAAVREFTGNPAARSKMPPQRLSPADLDKVIAFLKSLK